MGSLLLRSVHQELWSLDLTNMAAFCVCSLVLDQVQAFLPQLAQANEKLRKEMAVAPADRFDIENTEGTSGNIVQMVTALLTHVMGLVYLPRNGGR